MLNSRKDGLEVSLATAELLDSCFEIVDANAREKGKRLGWKVAHILKARILSYYLLQKGDGANTVAEPPIVAADMLGRSKCVVSMGQLFRLRSPDCTIFVAKESKMTSAEIKGTYFDRSFQLNALNRISLYKKGDSISFLDLPLTSQLWYPESDQKPGLDLMLQGVSKEGRHFLVAIQVKEFDPDSTTILGKPDIADMLVKVVGYHPWVADFIRNTQFFFVSVLRRSTTDELRDDRVSFEEMCGEIDKIIPPTGRS